MRLHLIKQIQGVSQAPFCCCCLWVCCQGCLTTLTNVLNKWQAALAGFPCTSNILLGVNPAVPLLLGRTSQTQPHVLQDQGCLAMGIATWSHVMVLWTQMAGSDGVVTLLHFFWFFSSLQLQYVRADVPLSFSILGQRVTFFMMALYCPYYLPFYYLKIYYLFMHQFNLLFCNELLCGRTWRFQNAIAVDLASPGGELIQWLFI